MPELKSFDRVAHCYDETRGMPPEVTATVAEATAAVLHELGPAPSLLEVGIGTGRIAVPLAERGVRVTGVDISPKMLAVLHSRRSDVETVLAEAARPPFRPASFDGVLFVHILHLVPNAEETVRAAVPLVGPGGVIIRGHEERPEGSLDERLGEILERTAREVSGIELEGWERHRKSMAAFERVVCEAGYALERRRVAEWLYPLTGRAVQEKLARKDNSASWQIPDEGLPALLAAMEPKVSQVFGGMDVERGGERAFDLTIARRQA